MITIRIAPIIYKFFVAFVLLVSLFGFENRFFILFEQKISYSDVMIIFVVLLLIPMFFKKLPNTTVSKKAVKLLYLILAYAFITTIWVNYSVSYWHTFYQLALAFTSITIPYLVAKITNDKYIDYHRMITNFSFLLSFVFFVYFIQDGIARLGGYLGGAALIGIVMIPVISVHLNNLLMRKRIIISVIGFLFTSFALFRTESRTALIMLILYVGVTLLRKPSIKRIVFLTLMALVFYTSFWSSISVNRYSNLTGDDARSTMFKSSIEWGTHSPTAFIFGNGYGSIWQWDAFQKGELPFWQFPFQPTEHGYVMFHPHSIFNQLFAELGLVGTIPLLVFILLLIKETWKTWNNKNELKTNIMIGILCSLPGMFADLLFFRNWETTIVWLFFVFTALNYPTKKDNESNLKENKTVMKAS